MKEVAIKDICKKDSSALKQKELLPEGKYPVFGASGIAGYLDRYHQKKEYIGIVKDGSGIGRVAFYPAESSLIGTMQYVLPKKNYDIRYIGYCLQSLDLSKYKQGAAIPHIYFRDYGEQLVKVTDNWEEQHSIVSRLDSAFSHIDALKANAEKQLNEARKLFQAELTECMRPKEGWEEKKLGEVCRIERGGSPRPIKAFITDDPNGLNWIKIGDTDPQGKYIYSTKEKIKREGLKKSRWVEEDEFLLSNSMSFGRPYILKTNGCIHDGWLVLRDYQKSLFIDYFYYMLLSSIVQKQFKMKAQGSTVSNLNTDRVSSVKISYPSLSVQHAIVSHLDSLSSTIRKLEELQQKTIAECDALKQAMLREVFE